MNTVFKIIIYYKKIKIAHPEMLLWLLVPIISLFAVTNYLFQEYNTEVLAVNIDQKSKLVGKTVPSKLSEIIVKKFEWKGNGIISLIFTGSYRSQFDIAFPELKSRGLTAAVSVPVSAVGLPETMTWLNLRYLQIQGWKIMSQSKDQICNVEVLDDVSVLENEIAGSKKELQDLGFNPDFYIPPCGILTEEIIDTVTKNYNGLITFGVETNNIASPNRYNLITRQVDNTVSIDEVKKWIKIASTERSWLIVSFPNIGHEIDNNHISFALLTQVLDEISKSDLQIEQPNNVIN